MSLNFEQVRRSLTGFLAEDLGDGDLTASLLAGRTGTGSFLVKDSGVIAGIDLPGFIYQLLGDHVTYTSLVNDGAKVKPGNIVAKASGSLADLLAAERLTLNLLQRMSGIATATQTAVKALADPAIQILDTRKTAPGLRLFDKYAVRCGGGVNHRMGLYDMAMLKDNHWQAVGDLKQALTQLRQVIGPTKKIEVEVETFTELQAAIAAQSDIIMFDNQTPETVRAWQKLVPNNIKIEVSGGISFDTIHNYAHSGVDFISLGYLTNSVKNLDISFNLN